LIQTITTDYAHYLLNNGAWAHVPIRKTVTWNQQNLVSKVETDFDTVAITGGTATWSNPIEIREYDWGTGAPGGLSRRTAFNYLHLQNVNYKNVNTADRVTSKIVYDGAGVVAAQTTFTYDGVAVTATSGAPQHDYTNYGSGNNVRGNLTKVAQGVPFLEPGRGEPTGACVLGLPNHSAENNRNKDALQAAHEVCAKEVAGRLPPPLLPLTYQGLHLLIGGKYAV
jgi:hypothetical protein